MEHLKKMGGGGCSTKGMTQVIELKNKNGGEGVHPQNPTPSSPNQQSALIYLYHVHCTLISIYFMY